jgi:hypothetical protein
MVIEVIGEMIPENWVEIDDSELIDLKGVVLITGSSGPFGQVEYVEIKVDSGPWKEAFGSDEWEYTLDTKQLGNGEGHLLQARAYANGRYSPIDSMTFSVNNSQETPVVSIEPTQSRDAMDQLFLPLLVAGAILIGFILVMVFVHITRSRKSSNREVDDLNLYDLNGK